MHAQLLLYLTRKTEIIRHIPEAELEQLYREEKNGILRNMDEEV